MPSRSDVLLMSLTFHGQLRPDDLVTGAITGFSVSLVVGRVLSRLIRELHLLAAVMP